MPADPAPPPGPIDVDAIRKRCEAAQEDGYDVSATAAAIDDIPALLAEVERLRLDARRFYRADGSSELLDTPEEAVRRRVEAAGEIDRLRAAAAERDALRNAAELVVVGWAIARHESERPDWLRALMPAIRGLVYAPAAGDGDIGCPSCGVIRTCAACGGSGGGDDPAHHCRECGGSGVCPKCAAPGPATA